MFFKRLAALDDHANPQGADRGGGDESPASTCGPQQSFADQPLDGFVQSHLGRAELGAEDPPGGQRLSRRPVAFSDTPAQSVLDAPVQGAISVNAFIIGSIRQHF